MKLVPVSSYSILDVLKTHHLFGISESWAFNIEGPLIHINMIIKLQFFLMKM